MIERGGSYICMANSWISNVDLISFFQEGNTLTALYNSKDFSLSNEPFSLWLELCLTVYYYMYLINKEVELYIWSYRQT